MVGKLGCGCCGPTIDNPTYYGLCDCGTDSQVLRGDYLEAFDETIPDLPIFYRPGGARGNTNPYTDWIYSGRFHLTCKPTWNNVNAAPYWSGYQEPGWFDIGKPYGIADTFEAYNSKGSKYKNQFVFNEFDYEYEWDFHVASSCKPAFVYRTGSRFPYKITAYLKIFDTAQATDFSLRYTNEITLVNAAYHESGSVYRNDLCLVNLFNGDGLNGLDDPPIKTLEYDRTYKLKKRLTSTAVYGMVGSPLLTVQWFLDGDFLVGYSNWTHSIFASWVNCNPGYARFLHCGEIVFSGYVDPYSLYRDDPSSSVWIDDFKFDAIPK